MKDIEQVLSLILTKLECISKQIKNFDRRLINLERQIQQPLVHVRPKRPFITHQRDLGFLDGSYENEDNRNERFIRPPTPFPCPSPITVHIDHAVHSDTEAEN